jgi:hypothetical protein
MGKTNHCQSCGEKLKPNSNFCESCGEKVYEEERESDFIPSSKRYSDYPKRILEIFIFLNVLTFLYSLSINWGYFYYTHSIINVLIALILCILNIYFLFLLHKGENKSVYWLGATAIVSFILLLNQQVLLTLFIISLLEFLVLYIIIFWLKHTIKK